MEKYLIPDGRGGLPLFRKTFEYLPPLELLPAVLAWTGNLDIAGVFFKIDDYHLANQHLDEIFEFQLWKSVENPFGYATVATSSGAPTNLLQSGSEGPAGPSGIFWGISHPSYDKVEDKFKKEMIKAICRLGDLACYFAFRERFNYSRPIGELEFFSAIERSSEILDEETRFANCEFLRELETRYFSGSDLCRRGLSGMLYSNPSEYILSRLSAAQIMKYCPIYVPTFLPRREFLERLVDLRLFSILKFYYNIYGLTPLDSVMLCCLRRHDFEMVDFLADVLQMKCDITPEAQLKVPRPPKTLPCLRASLRVNHPAFREAPRSPIRHQITRPQESFWNRARKSSEETGILPRYFGGKPGPS